MGKKAIKMRSKTFDFGMGAGTDSTDKQLLLQRPSMIYFNPYFLKLKTFVNKTNRLHKIL